MSLCIGCMREIADDVICPHCSFDNTKQQIAPLLPYGTLIEKRYIIGREVEINSESTRYIAFDRETGERVFIREFLPAGYISRAPMTAKVIVDSSRADASAKHLEDFEKLFDFLAGISDMSAMNEITDIFRANLTALLSDLDALQSYGEQSLSSLSSRELVTFHDGFSYFAEAFDLTILKAVEEESGAEASASELIELIQLVHRYDLPAIFTETNGADAAAKIISAETGVPLFSLDMAMSGDSYFEAMYRNIDTIKEALG